MNNIINQTESEVLAYLSEISRPIQFDDLQDILEIPAPILSQVITSLTDKGFIYNNQFIVINPKVTPLLNKFDDSNFISALLHFSANRKQQI